ncbi:hypothetical protein [Streptomyces sp. NPDC057617]|uniref:hypothetical protein n=1 Tax=Streptomyces sp. NPDC057617 TaxID=3346184 RepID=UPI00368FB2CD
MVVSGAAELGGVHLHALADPGHVLGERGEAVGEIPAGVGGVVAPDERPQPGGLGPYLRVQMRVGDPGRARQGLHGLEDPVVQEAGMAQPFAFGGELGLMGAARRGGGVQLPAGTEQSRRHGPGDPGVDEVRDGVGHRVPHGIAEPGHGRDCVGGGRERGQGEDGRRAGEDQTEADAGQKTERIGEIGPGVAVSRARERAARHQRARHHDRVGGHQGARGHPATAQRDRDQREALGEHHRYQGQPRPERPVAGPGGGGGDRDLDQPAQPEQHVRA